MNFSGIGGIGGGGGGPAGAGSTGGRLRTPHGGGGGARLRLEPERIAIRRALLRAVTPQRFEPHLRVRSDRCARHLASALVRLIRRRRRRHGRTRATCASRRSPQRRAPSSTRSQMFGRRRPGAGVSVSIDSRPVVRRDLHGDVQGPAVACRLRTAARSRRSESPVSFRAGR